jgi:hypothetical protein
MKMIEKFESEEEESESIVSPELSESAQNELRLMKPSMNPFDILTNR